MDIQPTDQKQSLSDDQELAKVLAGINDQADATNQQANDNGITTIPMPPTPMPQPPTLVDDSAQSDDNTPPMSIPPTPMPQPQPAAAPQSVSEPTSADPALDAIKQQALGELRPLVDKLNVEDEEKFDIYLLLLRSTDDRDLIAPAHEAAKAIADESKRAQALLDIIKEIDFLSQNQT